ncbi:MAG: HD domain-containing phosphohydrolase [Mycobacteriales bacterium]
MSIAANASPPATARVLVVDDEPVNLSLLHELLTSAGYTDVRCTTDPRSVVSTVVSWDADIVLLDLNMPRLDGYGVLEQLRFAHRSSEYLPVLVLTADNSAQARHRALRVGANDFLSKPFDPAEVLLRVGNLLETRYLHLALSAHNDLLEARVAERTAELEESRLEILDRLACAAEYRDDDTHEHTQRVGDLAALLSLELGYSDVDAEVLRRAAPLHDLGKIGIPDEILLKPGALTTEEFALVKQHTEIGARILAGSRADCLQLGEIIARTHHERWDGSGYLGMRGSDIPVGSRIVAVADVFDALTHERPYKHAWSRAEAVQYIHDGAAAQFDPMAVTAFLALVGEGRLDALDYTDDSRQVGRFAPGSSMLTG